MAQPPRSTSLHASDDAWYAELEQLVQRYEHGEISDDQFTMEKQRILQQSRRRRSQPSQPEKLLIVTAVYDDEREARSIYRTLIGLQDDDKGHVVDAAVLRRDAAGSVHITEHEELTPVAGAKRGALLGVLVGLIFPPTRVTGASSGAAANALISYLTERGFDDRELRALGVPLQTGQSAIFVVSSTRLATQLSEYLHSSSSTATYPLPGEIVTLVTATVDDDRPSTNS
jgi:uncharacterized membrane protein